MKTKHLIILIALGVLQASCGDGATSGTNKDITGKFQKTIPASDTRPGRIVMYEVKNIDAELFSIETSSKPLDKNVDFKKKFYIELEYRPNKRLLHGNTGLGSASFQFSKNLDTIRELGSDSKYPIVRVE